jgi:hypothetical protein
VTQAVTPPTALVRRARRINRELARLYPDAHIELSFTSPLELLVATILSARTTDRQVNEVTGPTDEQTARKLVKTGPFSLRAGRAERPRAACTYQPDTQLNTTADPPERAHTRCRRPVSPSRTAPCVWS